MSVKSKQKDISWLSFILFLIILYAIFTLISYAFAYISAPALEFDRKQKQTSQIK